MRYVRTYFTKGAVVDRRNIRIPFTIKDPPVAGTSYAFILGDGKLLILFHPATLQAYAVQNTSMEVMLAEDISFDLKHMIDFIDRKQKEYRSLKMARDYGTTAVVLLELNAQLPKEMVLDNFEVPDEEEDFLL